MSMAMNSQEIIRWALLQNAIQDIAEMTPDAAQEAFEEMVDSIDTLDSAFQGTISDHMSPDALRYLERYPRLPDVLAWEAKSGVGVMAVMRIRAETSKPSPNWPACLHDIEVLAYS